MTDRYAQDARDRARRSDSCVFVHLPVTSVNPEELGALDKHYGQIRPAGPEFIRDFSGGWDAVDQGSDESFPASDPPACMPPG